jgi:hypothetical protein
LFYHILFYHGTDRFWENGIIYFSFRNVPFNIQYYIRVIYMCVRDIEFTYFYDFSIECWNCSDSVIYIFSFYYRLWKKPAELQLLKKNMVVIVFRNKRKSHDFCTTIGQWSGDKPKRGYCFTMGQRGFGRMESFIFLYIWNQKCFIQYPVLHNYYTAWFSLVRFFFLFCQLIIRTLLTGFH